MDNRAGADASSVDECEQQEDGDGEELLGSESEFTGAKKVAPGGDRGQEDPGVFGEGDRDCRDRAGLDDGEKRSAAEESPEAPEGFAQVDALATFVGYGGGEFTIAEGGDDGEGRADH